MNSLLAAAGDLDQLLDELEENEASVSKQNDQRDVRKKEWNNTGTHSQPSSSRGKAQQNSKVKAKEKKNQKNIKTSVNSHRNVASINQLQGFDVDINNAYNIETANNINNFSNGVNTVDTSGNFYGNTESLLDMDFNGDDNLAEVILPTQEGKDDKITIEAENGVGGVMNTYTDSSATVPVEKAESDLNSFNLTGNKLLSMTVQPETLLIQKDSLDGLTDADEITGASNNVSDISAQYSNDLSSTTTMQAQPQDGSKDNLTTDDFYDDEFGDFSDLKLDSAAKSSDTTVNYKSDNEKFIAELFENPSNLNTNLMPNLSNHKPKLSPEISGNSGDEYRFPTTVKTAVVADNNEASATKYKAQKNNIPKSPINKVSDATQSYLTHYDNEVVNHVDNNTRSNGENTVVGFADNIDVSEEELSQFLNNDEIYDKVFNQTDESPDTEKSNSEAEVDRNAESINIVLNNSDQLPESSSNNTSSSFSQESQYVIIENPETTEVIENEVNHEQPNSSNANDEHLPDSDSNINSQLKTYSIKPTVSTNIHVSNQPSNSNTEEFDPDSIQVMPFEEPDPGELPVPKEPHSQSHLNTTNQTNPVQYQPSSSRHDIVPLGDVKPEWIPDSEAPVCGQCEARFTFTRRRHHCRACGRVFCSNCCSHRAALKYLGPNKVDRVCSMCYTAILQRAAMEANPNAADPYTETAVPVILGTDPSNSNLAVPAGPSHGSQSPNPSVRPKTTPSAQIPTPKSVRFADGTRPDHPQETPSTPPMPTRVPRSKRSKQPSGFNANSNEIPPVILSWKHGSIHQVEENPDINYISAILSSEGPDPIEFLLNPNLILKVKFLMCGTRHCWCFWSSGMSSVGQNEIAILFEREGLGDVKIPKDIFVIFNNLYDQARRGKVINNHNLITGSSLGFDKDQSWLGSKDNAGLLFVQPTYQFFCGFNFGDTSREPAVEHRKYFSVLFGILIHKSETPWAALVPKRLLLRLGAEMRQYPCPLFSVRQRQSVFSEIGHTILGILCDFTNFKYKVMMVPGLKIIINSLGTVSLHIPCNRFTDVIKIINSSSNESVFAVAAGPISPPSEKKSEPNEPDSEFDETAEMDSHLVCIQDTKTLKYRTEMLTMKNIQPQNTGACFIVFNGSLHSDTSETEIKATIIEDGVMVQILPEKMSEFISSLKAMDDFRLENNNSSSPKAVEICWVKDDTNFNFGLYSPIDYLSFEGILGFNVQGRSEQRGKRHIIRWNQVFFISNTGGDTLDSSRLAEQIANSVFLALTPLLPELADNEQTKLAVRVTIHPDEVSYLAGSKGNPLPQNCMNSLDDQLVATIHNAAGNVLDGSEPIVLELVFSVLNMRYNFISANMDI